MERIKEVAGAFNFKDNLKDAENKLKMNQVTDAV